MKTNDQDKFDCQDVEKNVQAYLDNMLSEREALLLEDHLSYCLPCDKKIEFEKKFKEFVRLKSSEKSYPSELESELKKIVRGD